MGCDKYPMCQTNYFECWCEIDARKEAAELSRPIPIHRSLTAEVGVEPKSDTFADQYNRMRDHAITALVDAGAPERASKFASEWPRRTK